jgi:acyl-CoA reductase-like NAD-dependent aldehyde dehydrogenase
LWEGRAGGARRLRVGIVHINDQMVADEPFAPFGGTGASGNGAAHGGPANWDTFYALAVDDHAREAASLSVLRAKG